MCGKTVGVTGGVQTVIKMEDMMEDPSILSRKQTGSAQENSYVSMRKRTKNQRIVACRKICHSLYIRRFFIEINRLFLLV